MLSLKLRWIAAAIPLVGLLTLASCESDRKPSPTGSATATSKFDFETGEAGGVAEDSITVTTTVSAIDKATRSVTLTGAEGRQASFTAGPEIRNFDQLRVGDRVEATLIERLKVFVRSGEEEPSVSHSAAIAAAPKGAKPGVMAGEMYEVVATVKAIDPETRTATLLFSDGQSRTVPIRRDVELSRYKVGDNVVIRVSTALSVIVKKP